jgi:uncharacterized protein (DUF1800 family)
MAFDPTLAAIRFGTGLSPVHTAPVSLHDLKMDLQGADTMAVAIPIEPFDTATPRPAVYQQIQKAVRAAETETDKALADAKIRQWVAEARSLQSRNLMKTMARSIVAPIGLRERLTAFWADHFTAKGRNRFVRHLVTSFIEEAIRPHVTGSFSDMLRAVTTHPVMLLYLQQSNSHGPNSPRGQRNGKGLNENLARELMELHTLGVGSHYDQTDVTELAELLTGLTYRPANGFSFDPRMAEPGSETVLGVSYGADATLQTVYNAIDDLALHPDTAHHIATKLAIHFVSDTPDPALVGAMGEVFLGTQGDLGAVMEALLEHPSSWIPERTKVRPPIEFMNAAFRALNVAPEALIAADHATYRTWIERPLRIMGQPFQDPNGPDGWPETAQDWIIPQTMAGRINWAMHAPDVFLDQLPDPRVFVHTALGSTPPEAVVMVADAAESRSDGIGLVLASPSFQRR